MLLASRVIEGIGMGLIVIVAPAVIAMWFPKQKRGVPMGIWATWVPAGSMIMYNVAPFLGTTIGWQAVWWFGAAFALVAAILYWILIRTPPDPAGTIDTSDIDEGRSAEEQPSLVRALANRHIWLLALEFCCFNMAFVAVITFVPTFLVSVRDYSLATASFVTSLAMIVGLASCPLGGWILDRIGSRKLVYTVPLLIVSAMWWLPFTSTGWLIPAFMVALGLIGGPIPTATFAAAPEVMERPQLVGISMAVVALGQNLGMLIGPVMFGKLVEAASWAVAGYILIPISVIGVVAGWLVKVR